MHKSFILCFQRSGAAMIILKLFEKFLKDSYTTVFFTGAPVMDENTQPQVHVRCSDVNAVCEARKMVRSSFILIADQEFCYISRFSRNLVFDPESVFLLKLQRSRKTDFFWF